MAQEAGKKAEANLGVDRVTKAHLANYRQLCDTAQA